MPRYEPRWPDVPREQRASLPPIVRQLIDQRIEELLEDPSGAPARYYPPPRDVWITPFGADDEGLITYAVVKEPRPVVILLRLVYAGPLT